MERKKKKKKDEKETDGYTHSRYLNRRIKTGNNWRRHPER